MAGGFEAINPEQCAHYAAFASHLGRKPFDVIYWLLFGLVIIMLFLASWKYSRDHETTKDIEPGTHEYKRRMMKCLFACLACLAVSVVAIVMEVYALLALQFCDGEDLMSLYWSTWTMLQLGSLVAIAGIILAVFNNIRGNKNPPWALALGTPVLVVAGIGHAVHFSMRKRVEKVRERSSSRRGVSVSSSMSRLEGVLTSDLPMSREDTLRMDDSEKEDVDCKEAKLVGFTPDGGAIIQFSEEPGTFRPELGSILGRGENNQVVVAFHKSMTTIVPYGVSLDKPAPTPTPGPNAPSSPNPSVVRPPPTIRISTPSGARDDSPV